MNEVISLEGLRKLASMHQKGERLPENYKNLVVRYLRHKERWINSEKCKDEYAVEKFIEALRLAKKLGIVWKVKRLRY